jgi:hypothetical protein
MQPLDFLRKYLPLSKMEKGLGVRSKETLSQEAYFMNYKNKKQRI